MHPYEVAKASQDLIAQSYGRVYGSPVAVTRCGNYFGGYDFNFERLIPGTIRSLLLGDRPVLRSDGRFTRDFLYIEDAVDAQLMLAERLARDPAIRGQAFNFSYQMDAQVIDIVTLIAGLMGSPLRPKIEDRSHSEIRNMSLSAAKARSRLGWTARHGFEAGLQKTIKWYSEHLGGRS